MSCNKCTEPRIHHRQDTGPHRHPEEVPRFLCSQGLPQPLGAADRISGTYFRLL